MATESYAKPDGAAGEYDSLLLLLCLIALELDHVLIPCLKLKIQVWNLSSTLPTYLSCHPSIISEKHLIKRGKRAIEQQIFKEKISDMACFAPFNSRNLEICLVAFRPTIVLVDDLVECLKYFCLCTENLGCLHSAVFRSIHGNMIIWYGAWIKRSNEEKELLSSALRSMLTNVANMAISIDYSFYKAYAGESRQGSTAAKFFNGDIICMNSITLSSEEKNETGFPYACLALFTTRFLKMEGATAGVCLKSQSRPRVIGFFIWESLQSCYSYILNTDIRKTILPYFVRLSPDIKYDIFRVVYVRGSQKGKKKKKKLGATMP